MNIELNTFTVVEAIRTEPKITLDLITDQPINSVKSNLIEDMLGYNGFITEIRDSTIYGTLIDSDSYNQVRSMYLGDSLNAAVKSLNIKPLVTGVPDLNQEFFALNELSWSCLCRLMSYLPSEYFWYCSSDEVKVFKKPDSFRTCIASEFHSDLINARYLPKNLILDSEHNPSYHSIYSVPVCKLAKENALFSSDMIRNNMQNYIYRGNIYSNNMILTCMDTYGIGEGLSVNGVNYMVVFRSTTFDKNYALKTSTYKLVGV